MSTMEKSRRWSGPALFSYGFRPFFLGGAVWAAAMVAIWVGWLAGAWGLPSALPPVAWHAHELLFGYVPAVVAGFLLTAVPNWTGRLPVVGLPLVGLFSLWLAGRVAVAISAWIGVWPGLLLSLLFPLLLAGFAAREIVAAGNRRNVVVLALVAVFTLGEAVFAIEVAAEGMSVYGQRLAIAATVMLVMLIGGRITPSFTTNWLKRGDPALPATFGRADAVALGLGGLGLLAFVAAPALGGAEPLLAALMAAGGLAQILRQARWRPLATGAEPLLAVLHAGYLFVGLGFLAGAAGTMLADPMTGLAGTHLWTMGAIGLMTLGVMTRATRGHTGRDLTAPPSTTALYAAVVVATLARLAALVAPSLADAALTAAAILWVLAFGGFAVLYGPMLIGPRKGA